LTSEWVEPIIHPMSIFTERRRFLKAAGLITAASLLAGCDPIDDLLREVGGQNETNRGI